MGLSTSLSIAQSALQNNAGLTTVVSRNISGVNDPGYSRKIGTIVSNADGSNPQVSVSRATNDQLFNYLLGSTSDAASSQALSDGLDQLEQTVNLTTNASNTESSSDASGNSPAALLGTLSNALQTYAAAPSDAATAQAFLAAAKSMATGLNQASQTTQAVRLQADQGIATAVTDINTLLSQFGDLNTQIVTATATGADASDLQDKRDQILTSLSKDIGISTVPAANGGMSIYTDSGVTLFQGTARTVSFTPTASFADGTVGNAVSIDGVPVTGASAVMPIASGKIAGLAQLRDTTTVNYQNQLNQIASTLVTAFADSDQTGGGAPTIPGLFTYAGAPAMPSTGQTGLATSIAVNANADPSQGGSLNRMRDGGVGDPGNSAYNANTAGAASFSTHLNALATQLGAQRSFDASSGGSSAGSLAVYAASSISWLEASRSSTSTTLTNNNASVTQATTSLSNATGVNLDDQLSKMLDLEHSYSASAELMQTVNSMYSSLISSMQ